MKYLFGFVLGLVLGAICAAALIYFNPLIQADAEPAPLPESAWRYALAGDRLLVSAHDRALGFPGSPAGVQPLWETGIKGIWLQSFVTATGDGAPAAVATKLVLPSVASNAMTKGLVTEDQWLITVPGRGTMAAFGSSNVWPLIRDSVVTVDWLQREWPGTRAYGMLDDNAGRLIGTAGNYAGQTGRLAETVVLGNYPAGGFASLTGEISVEFDAP